jgi:soluble lytic murein transglycosylase-like protein
MLPLLEASAARQRAIRPRCIIPQFAKTLAHSSVPLICPSAVARSGGQERPKAGARALLLTAASTAARSPCLAASRVQRTAFRAAVVFLVVGVTSVMATSAKQAGGAAQSTAIASQSDNTYAEHIAEAARRFGIPSAWIGAVMRVESSNDPRALSPKGAIGLMQIMPNTWRELRARYALGADPYDPRDNILAGAAYLRELHDRFGSPGFLAAYNAGPDRYAQHLATGQALPDETRTYVAMLMPVIDGGQSERSPDHAVDAILWRSASLFAPPVGGRLKGQDSASSLLPAHTSRDTTIVDLSALVPPSNGLFVRRPDVEHAP